MMDEGCEQLQRDYDALRRVHDAANRAIESLEIRNKELARETEILQSQKKQLEVQKITQQEVFQKALDKANEQNNRYLEEITHLRDEGN